MFVQQQTHSQSTQVSNPGSSWPSCLALEFSALFTVPAWTAFPTTSVASQRFDFLQLLRPPDFLSKVSEFIPTLLISGFTADKLACSCQVLLLLSQVIFSGLKWLTSFMSLSRVLFIVCNCFCNKFSFDLSGLLPVCANPANKLSAGLWTCLLAFSDLTLSQLKLEEMQCSSTKGILVMRLSSDLFCIYWFRQVKKLKFF